MQITKVLTPYNFTDKNNTGRIKYIVVHYFGYLGTAAGLAKTWASKYTGASAHYAVGHAGDVYQMVEDGDVAWHCGASKYKHKECRNSNSIGIEMAVRKKSTATMSAADKDWYFEEATVQAAAELVAEKMQQYNIPLDNVIRHYDVTGKTCPNPYVVKSDAWTAFKKRIEAILTGKQPDAPPAENTEPGETENKVTEEIYGSLEVIYDGKDGLNVRREPTTDKPNVKETIFKGTRLIVTGKIGNWYRVAGDLYVSASSKYVSFTQGWKVKVTDSSLNIRSTPEAKNDSNIVGCIRDMGVYRIVHQTADGWGRLYSGAGWIKLRYTKKVD